VFILPAALNEPIRVAAPPLPAGAKAAGDAESFGPFETYLMLAMRIDPQRALEAADVVEGARAAAYRARGKLCYGIAFATTGATNRSFLSSALAAWARTMPSAHLTSAGSRLRLTTCDPGATAKSPPKDRVNRAAELVLVRSGLTEGFVSAGALLPRARCVARLFVRSPGVVDMVLAIGTGSPNASQKARLQSVTLAGATRCQVDIDSGMP
jgi:hypothetical protein